jgi:hypothetical protein
MIIMDTGVLYALADRRDTHHNACVRWLTAAPRPLIVPPLVIAEARYLIGKHLGATAEATFLDAFGRFSSGCDGCQIRQVSPPPTSSRPTGPRATSSPSRNSANRDRDRRQRVSRGTPALDIRVGRGGAAL